MTTALLIAIAFGQAGQIGPEIAWSTDLATALAEAKREGKPVVVCFVAGWCAVCRRFESDTLLSQDLRALAERCKWVKLEIDRNVSLVRTYNIRSTPTIYFIDADAVTRVRVSGFLGAGEFVRLFEEFDRDRASPPGEPKDIDGTDLTALTMTADGFRGGGICFSNVGYGPLRLPSQSTFQSLRYGLVPRTPSTLAQGVMEFQVSESWSNLWALDEGDHLIDFETLQTSVAFSYGVSDVLQLEAGFVQRSRFGGMMDGFIQGFHDLFGVDQGGRDDVPKGDFQFEVAGEDGEPVARLTNADRGSFTESLLLTLQHNVTCGTDVIPAFAYGVTLRTELGDQDEIENGQPVDLSTFVSTSKRFGDFYVYLSVGFAWFGKEDFQGIELRTTQLSGLLAVEWQFSAGMSLSIQHLVSEGVAEDLEEFSDPSHEITVGLKWEVLPLTVLEFGLIENVITSDNSPDFGIHIGLMVRMSDR